MLATTRAENILLASFSSCYPSVNVELIADYGDYVMSQYLEHTLNKFTFKVAVDRLYTAQGVWAKADGDQVTVGVSDFFQQHHGDVAFVEVKEVGTAVAAHDEFANIETVKVDIELACPVSGAIVAVNELLELEAERINQDPYGAGWLAIIAAGDWSADQARLLAPAAYFAHMKTQAQNEVQNQ
jgi:glycine cleavage system H protein